MELTGYLNNQSLIMQLNSCLHGFDISNVSDEDYQRAVSQQRAEFLKLIKAKMGVLREIAAGVIIGMAIASLIGNSLVCCVLHNRRSLRTTTNIFLVNLSLAQMLLACVAIPINLMKILVIAQTWSMGRASCSVAHFTNSLCTCASSLILVCIAIDRHRVIVAPLKPRLTDRTVRLMLAGCWTVSVAMGLVNSQVLFASQTRAKGSAVTIRRVYALQDETVCAFMPAEDSRLRLALSCLAFLCQYVMPLIVILVIYARIIRSLRSARAELTGDAGRSGSNRAAVRLPTRRNTIIMLIVVMLLFFISWSPIHLFVISSNWRIVTDVHKEVMLHAVCYWLAMSNVWYNPIIYAWLNARFRASLLQFLTAPCARRRCCRGGDGGDQERPEAAFANQDVELNDLICSRRLEAVHADRNLVAVG